jgi:hypothetical protein
LPTPLIQEWIRETVQKDKALQKHSQHELIDSAEKLPSVRGSIPIVIEEEEDIVQGTIRELEQDEDEMDSIKKLLTSASQPKRHDHAMDIKTRVTDTIEIKESQKQNVSRIRSGDYRAWDRFDVEAELKKLDVDPNTTTTTTTNANACGSEFNTTRMGPRQDMFDGIPTTLESAKPNLTTEEKRVLADRERIKGNEAFKAKDFREAVSLL